MPHTPGPWRVNGDYGNRDQHPNLTIESDFGQITKVMSENCDVDEQVIADAKLIAAAPDLLAACQSFLAEFREYIDDDNYDLPDTRALEAAIAKATE